MKSIIQSNLKAVIFDFDNTLYHECQYFEHIFTELNSSRNLNLPLDDIINVFNNLRPTSHDIFKDILEYFERFSPSEANIIREELFIISQKIDANIIAHDDALPFLIQLKKHNIKKFILTNGVPVIQKNKFKCLNIKNHFNGFYCARELGNGFEKPNTIIFETLLNKLNYKNDEVLFIGDNPNTDFKGPFEIGSNQLRLCRGIYKDMPYNGKEIREINFYSEILI
jgi:HAD superfamily hydrolase (TIGR01549 family)